MLQSKPTMPVKFLSMIRLYDKSLRSTWISSSVLILTVSCLCFFVVQNHQLGTDLPWSIYVYTPTSPGFWSLWFPESQREVYLSLPPLSLQDIIYYLKLNTFMHQNIVWRSAKVKINCQNRWRNATGNATFKMLLASWSMNFKIWWSIVRFTLDYTPVLLKIIQNGKKASSERQFSG